MLYGSTSSCALVSLALPPVGQLADAPLKLSEHAGAHRTVAEALHVSHNGKYVVSGGNDRIVKVWDGKQLAKPSTARGRKASADVQAFVGHSDHVTRVAFSADGTSLLTVGGGDAIFVWEFCGDAAVDEAAVVEASIEQAEAERMKALALDDDHAPSPRTTPAQALNMPSALPAAAAAAASVAAAQAAGIYGDEIMPPVPEGAIEALRARLRHLEEEDDDEEAPAARGGRVAWGAKTEEEFEEAFEAAGAAAAEEEAFLTRKHAFEEAFGTPFKKQAFEQDEEEEAAVGKAARTRDGAEAFGGRELLDLPKKRFQPNPLYEDDEADDDDDDDDEEDDDEDDSYEEEAEAEAAARAEQESGGDDALAALASAVSLERLLGFSTHAHDHVLWHPEHGRLIYASGDTLMLHYYAAPGGPSQQPLRAGGGEIATLGGSDDHALVAVGAGGDAPIAVWDLSGAAPRLGVRLPGHQGGVQALAFSHSQAVGGCDLLASLGLADGSLRLSQLSTAQPLLHAALARPQHVVSWSHDNLELATGGAGGLYGWRVGWDEVDEADGGRGAVTDGGGGVVTLAYLEPQPARVPWSADGDGGGTRDPHAQLTAVVHLAALHGDAPCILTGDTAGCLALWGEGEAPLAVWSCAHALQEIDLLHASAVDDEETMGGGSAKWVVVVAGAGPTREVLRFELTMPTDGASAPTIAPLSRTSLDGAAVGMAWSDGAAQGIVGTDAGNIWHVHWASPQPATPLVSAVPPPMTQLAMPRQLSSSGGGGGGGGGHAPPPAGMATVSRGTVMDGAACGVLLWDARRAGCAQPLARVHFATDVATCVALSPTSGGRDGEGEIALAIGYASGAVRLLYVDQLAMEPTPLCQHAEAVVALAFAPHGRVLSATAAGDVRLSSVAEGSQTVRGAPPPPPPPPSKRASICVAAARTHIDALDVLPMNLPGLSASACWLCATAAQEVQVWPLVLPIVPDQRAGDTASVSAAAAAAAAAAAPPPLAQLQLERDDALISLPTEMQPLGWRCLAVFCPYHPQLVAACGVTQRKQVGSCDLLAPEP